MPAGAVAATFWGFETRRAEPGSQGRGAEHPAEGLLAPGPRMGRLSAWVQLLQPALIGVGSISVRCNAQSKQMAHVAELPLSRTRFQVLVIRNPRLRLRFETTCPNMIRVFARPDPCRASRPGPAATKSCFAVAIRHLGGTSDTGSDCLLPAPIVTWTCV